MAQSSESLEKSTLKIQASDETHVFQVELAVTAQQKAYGLMYRNSMPVDQGMLFDYQIPQIATMWMKNTYIPLDMVFIRENGVIENIIQRTVPHSLDVLSSTAKVRAVLELNAGVTSKLKIKPGDEVKHAIFANLTN